MCHVEACSHCLVCVSQRSDSGLVRGEAPPSCGVYVRMEDSVLSVTCPEVIVSFKPSHWLSLWFLTWFFYIKRFFKCFRYSHRKCVYKSCSFQFKQQMILEGKIAATHVQIHTEQTCCSLQPGHEHTGCPSMHMLKTFALALAEGSGGSAFPDVLHLSISFPPRSTGLVWQTIWVCLKSADKVSQPCGEA